MSSDWNLNEFVFDFPRKAFFADSCCTFSREARFAEELSGSKQFWRQRRLAGPKENYFSSKSPTTFYWKQDYCCWRTKKLFKHWTIQFSSEKPAKSSEKKKRAERPWKSTTTEIIRGLKIEQEKLIVAKIYSPIFLAPIHGSGEIRQKRDKF